MCPLAFRMVRYIALPFAVGTVGAVVAAAVAGAELVAPVLPGPVLWQRTLVRLRAGPVMLLLSEAFSLFPNIVFADVG